MGARFLIVLFFALILASCGKKSADELRLDAIDEADFFLTDGHCQEAIDVLEAAGRDSHNARFTKKLATAYACRAGFEAASFFVDDLPLIGSAPSELGGLARFKLARLMDAPKNGSYLDLQTAIKLLLYAGGLAPSENPSVSARRMALGTDAGKEVDSLLMYLMINQLGQYLSYYGNTSAAGEKGAQDLSANKCLVSYDNLAFDNPIAGGINNIYDYLDLETRDSCSSATATSGHVELGGVGDLNTARLCEGAILLNNFLEVFPTVIGELLGADFDDLSGINAILEAVKGVLVAAEPATSEVVQVKSQALCEKQNSTTSENLQFYFATMIEGIFL